jgi:hypothetical protein
MECQEQLGTAVVVPLNVLKQRTAYLKFMKLLPFLAFLPSQTENTNESPENKTVSIVDKTEYDPDQLLMNL